MTPLLKGLTLHLSGPPDVLFLKVPSIKFENTDLEQDIHGAFLILYILLNCNSTTEFCEEICCFIKAYFHKVFIYTLRICIQYKVPFQGNSRYVDDALGMPLPD